MGFSAFDVPANSTGISVQVLYYDFKNGSQASAAGSLLRCNDTTNRNSAATHNPGNGNANIALRTDDYTTNPKSGAAWTVAEVNGTGTNALTAFGVRVTDASPTVAFSSALLQVTYTEPITGTGALNAQSSTVSGAGTVQWVGTGALSAQSATVSGEGTVEDADSGITGTGALASASATMAGAGVGLSTGTGALSAASSTMEGVGIVQWVGIGALSAGFATMAGEGTVSGGVVVVSVPPAQLQLSRIGLYIGL
jgi:hypothetical protein